MNLGSAEQAALAAVAKHYPGTWRAGDGARSSSLVAEEGQQVVVEVIVLAQRESEPGSGPIPRLREDRVAQRVLHDLEAAVGGHVPRSRAVIVTLGAPIRVPNQLVAALAERLRHQLRSGPVDTDVQLELLGNRVRFRVLRDGPAWAFPVNGFVFSGDPGPGALADAMRAMRDRITAAAKAGARRRPTGARWLVLACDHPIADGRTHRRALSRLSVPDAFARILLVSAQRRVEILTG